MRGFELRSRDRFAKFAKLRVRWNILNLYIYLYWLTIEEQFIPALGIASAVSILAAEFD